MWRCPRGWSAAWYLRPGGAGTQESRGSSWPACESWRAARWWRTTGGGRTSPASPAPAWRGWCPWTGTQCPPLVEQRLLSNACTLASRMLIEVPCGQDRSRCLISPRLPPRRFLQCWGECIDGSRDGLLTVFVVGVVAGVCPFHLFLNFSSDVYIWKPQSARQQRRQEESIQSHKLTISLSWRATRSYMPSLSSTTHKKHKKSVKSINLLKLLIIHTFT